MVWDLASCRREGHIPIAKAQTRARIPCSPCACTSSMRVRAAAPPRDGPTRLYGEHHETRPEPLTKKEKVANCRPLAPRSRRVSLISREFGTQLPRAYAADRLQQLHTRPPCACHMGEENGGLLSRAPPKKTRRLSRPAASNSAPGQGRNRRRSFHEAVRVAHHLIHPRASSWGSARLAVDAFR
jgi:hypothetical protein